jgi:uncharacterized membrane protein YkvA (DUF1232 family)
MAGDVGGVRGDGSGGDPARGAATDRADAAAVDLAALPPDARAAATEPGSPLPRFWAAIKRLPRYARVAAALVADPAVPVKSKVMLGAGGLYLASPIDLVPGVIPVAGQLDDLYVLLRALRQALHSAPPDVSARHLHAVSLTMRDVEDDIRSMEETALWLVRRGARAGGSAASRGLATGRRVASGGLRLGRAVAEDGLRRLRRDRGEPAAPGALPEGDRDTREPEGQSERR